MMGQQNKKQMIILGVMGLLLVGVLVYQLMPKGGTTPAAGKKAAAGTTGTKTTAEPTPVFRTVDVDPTEMMKIVTYKPQKYTRGRNPLEPTPLTPGDSALDTGVVVNTDEVRDKIKNVKEKSVSAIIFDNVHPMAVVDDEIVEIGYVYPDGIVKIHAIEPDKVIFEVEQMLVPVDMKEL